VIFLSSPHDANDFPSGEKHTPRTAESYVIDAI